jgi:hypothetical protein
LHVCIERPRSSGRIDPGITDSKVILFHQDSRRILRDRDKQKLGHSEGLGAVVNVNSSQFAIYERVLVLLLHMYNVY